MILWPASIAPVIVGIAFQKFGPGSKDAARVFFKDHLKQNNDWLRDIIFRLHQLAIPGITGRAAAARCGPRR